MPAPQPPKLSFALKIKDLRVDDGAGQAILKIDDLTLPAGASLGIRGASGAGKSTLLLTLAGLLQAQSGQIWWGDMDVLSLSAADAARFRATHIGLIFQDFMLFEELGPIENASIQALFAPKAQRPSLRSRAQDLLDRFKVPPATRSVAHFSGGEQQRIALARALTHDPQIILADEPTASLHRGAAQDLGADLVAQSKAQGRSLIVASHDEDLLAQMDQVIDLAQGRFVARHAP